MLKSTERKLSSLAAPYMTTHPLRLLGLLLLCSAYLQGSTMKFLDFDAAIREMEHFGLLPPAPIAAAVIFFEFFCCVLVLTGFCRWIGALALAIFTLMATFIALRFWELPPGMGRVLATNAFFEHLGLVGAFLLVVWYDLHRWKNWRKEDWS